MGQLLIAFGESGLGRKYPLTKECIIGRHPECDIQLIDSKVSKRHARIFSNRGYFYIQDMKSLNGVFVNSSRIKEPTRISPNDVITIGAQSYLFSPSMDILPMSDSDKAVLILEEKDTLPGTMIFHEANTDEQLSA